MESLFDQYLIFKQLPKGEIITNPDELVFVCLLGQFVKKYISTPDDKVYITRRSLKHIAEKRNDQFIKLISEICSDPQEIRKSKVENRYLLSKNITILGGRPHVVCIEVVQEKSAIIITIFSSDEKYLSNFDLLWRTGVS